MSEVLFTGERFIPGVNDKKLSIEHYQRYKSVLPYVKGKVVLDAACGEGYGSNLMADYASSVIGIDIDGCTIENASKKYASCKDNLCYIQGSIADLSMVENASVDVLISFETIEHVSEEIQLQFLKEIKRVLKADGVLFMSTPNKKIYSDLYHYKNEFHVKEFYYNEFMDFLKKQFQFVRFYNQSYEVLSLLADISEKIDNIYFESKEEFNGDMAKYFVAVASDKDISNYKLSSACLYDTNEYDHYINRILELQNEEEKRNNHIAKLDIIINEQNAIKEENATIKEENAAVKEELENQKVQNNNLQGHIEQLLQKEREYEHLKNTKAYKLIGIVQKTGDFVLPKNSKRRFFARVLYNSFRYPKLMLKMINYKRIKNYLKYVKLEGMEGVNRRYQEAKELEEVRVYPNKKIEYDIVANEGDEKLSIRDFEKLNLPQCLEPQVSIIIPVFNEFMYTYNCIQSIIKNSGNVTYEVIVANDCSTDITQNIEQIIDNVKLISTKKNMRFLLNCNNAAKYAKGKYILFLNNDTQVQENWLEPLVTLIENNDTIGMVGSKLVYPDGLLQEAGGIVWKDASAWNYGHRCHPDDPEYNYVKEVDYISGAAIMIRKSLWNEIGGFDERFAPAYYEDTDLAFEVRRHGYKVMYQPLSVVVHFEGISNGIDITKGLKHYQEINHDKFYEKWKDILEQEHYENGENIFCAKDRSGQKRQILVVDHYVPHYDKDAGGRCTYMYLKLFVKMGFKVTFIGDNFYKHEPYTTELNQMGIEVLYGNYYCNNWKNWLKENAHYFDYIYLQRPHISIKYIDLAKKYSNAKIIYFAHDLHHIREQREYEITKNPEKLVSSQKWKKIEYELFEKADVGHVVGSYEQEIMSKAFPNKPIRNIPLYIYDNQFVNNNLSFENRKDLMYIGGFGHNPNVDAVLWFAKEVMPYIIRVYPDIKWHVIGGKAPKEILDLASPNIILEGFVSDEELEYFYRTCKIAVVPLRYGAGVKGKVVEAQYYQIPLVTTSIGAEGLSTKEASMIVEDDPKVMAEKICELYQDETQLLKLTENSKVFINKYFTLEEAKHVISLDIF